MNKGELFSRRNLEFMLFENHKVPELLKNPFYQAHDRETIGLALDTATDIANRHMKPAFVDSDRNPPFIREGQVTVHPGTHSFYHAFSESGLLASTFPEALGGMQLPRSVFAAIDFIIGSAHNGFEMFTSLAVSASRLIESFGSKDQKALYLPRLLTGDWAATMCLTESQAGSSLNDISTTAFPQPDGNYKIKGQKIFISAGDHDITENIVHLVLARIEGAPKGVKGISLFIVPKKWPDASGSLKDNDITSVGIFHKMGQQSTPAMHLEFGAGHRCTGYLIGEQNQGLKYMFQMMNTSRLAVGLAGGYMASAAYYTSLQYAKERIQGRSPEDKNPLSEPVPIIRHPDVRRLLFKQKAFTEGCLSLVIQCQVYLDRIQIAATVEEKKKYEQLLELMTPMVKVYGSEEGNASVHAGLQVLGGYGYTRDFILEQLARDVRILSIYEGTTAIQGQTLLGRHILGGDGSILDLWQTETEHDLIMALSKNELKPYALRLSEEITGFISVSRELIRKSRQNSPVPVLADASLYIEWFGLLNAGWQWIKQAHTAISALEQSISPDDQLFYRSKLETMRYFFHYELPRTQALLQRVGEGSPITIFTPDEFLI